MARTIRLSLFKRPAQFLDFLLKSCGWSSRPLSLLDHKHGDQQRPRSEYACCLVSKLVKAWVEPMLYEKVVLESSNQVMAFLNALEFKPVGLLTRIVKAVCIPDNSFPEDSIDRFPLLFNRCLSLEHLTYLGDEPCSRILQTFLEVQSAPHAPRELTTIQPSQENALNAAIHLGRATS